MTRAEFLLLLRHPDTVRAFCDLLHRNEIVPVVDIDVITGYDLTGKGRTRLAGMRMPAASE